MIIKCVSGFFIIRDETTWEIPRFIDITGFDLTSYRDFFTFSDISEAEQYSLVGKPYLGVTALKTFEGEPWEVMSENDIIYDFKDGKAKLIELVTEKLLLQSAGQFYISNGLIVPGSLRDDGLRVTDYSARFIWDSMSFRYSEVVCG